MLHVAFRGCSGEPKSKTFLETMRFHSLRGQCLHKTTITPACQKKSLHRLRTVAPSHKAPMARSAPAPHDRRKKKILYKTQLHKLYPSYKWTTRHWNSESVSTDHPIPGLRTIRSRYESMVDSWDGTRQESWDPGCPDLLLMVTEEEALPCQVPVTPIVTPKITINCRYKTVPKWPCIGLQTRSEINTPSPKSAKVGKCPIATRGKLACCISLAKRGMKNLPTNLWSATTPWIGWQLENRQFEFGSWALDLSVWGWMFWRDFCPRETRQC